MNRREFITLLAVAPAAWPLAARAQQSGGMRRIGVLISLAENDPEGQARIAAFLRGLQQLGWADSHNLQIDTRWCAGDAGLLRKYAAELVALGPDVILAAGERRGFFRSSRSQNAIYCQRERADNNRDGDHDHAEHEHRQQQINSRHRAASGLGVSLSAAPCH